MSICPPSNGLSLDADYKYETKEKIKNWLQMGTSCLPDWGQHPEQIHNVFHIKNKQGKISDAFTFFWMRRKTSSNPYALILAIKILKEDGKTSYWRGRVLKLSSSLNNNYSINNNNNNNEMQVYLDRLKDAISIHKIDPMIGVPESIFKVTCPAPRMRIRR